MIEGKKKTYKADSVTFDCKKDFIKRKEIDCRDSLSIISIWIGNKYYEFSLPEIREKLMKEKPKEAEWVVIPISIFN